VDGVVALVGGLQRRQLRREFVMSREHRRSTRTFA
jgi:hypothetical protein